MAEFSTVQITARWGDYVVGVFRVASRDGFRAGAAADVDFWAPIDAIEVVPARETWSDAERPSSVYRASAAHATAGDLAFDVEGVPPRWAHAARKPTLRAAIAMLATLAAHACFAFFAARPPVDEDAASAERFRSMAAYLLKSDEAQMEEEEVDDHEGLAPKMQHPRFYPWRRWMDELDPLPDGRDGCSAFGSFWIIAKACGGPMDGTATTPDSWGTLLSDRMVTDSFHAHERGLGEPSMRIDRLKVEGSVSRADVARALEERRPSVVRCYDLALSVNPDLAGRLSLALSIQKTGAPEPKLRAPAPPGMIDLAECAVRRFHPMRHFSERDEPTNATFDFVFTPY